MEGNGCFHAVAALFPSKKSYNYWIGGYVGPEVILDNMSEIEPRLCSARDLVIISWRATYLI
jgi:hypothetical protein